MNIKKIGLHIFLLPVYIAILAMVCFIIYAIAFGLWSMFEFTFLSGWTQFFISIGSIWAIALFFFFVEKA